MGGDECQRWKVVVRPAMIFGCEVALTKRQETDLEVAEEGRFSLGVSRINKIRNDHIRGAAQVEQFGEE